MPTSSPFVALSSPEILDEVLVVQLRFKQASAVFEKRPPDEETASVLVEAFSSGRAPAWLAAYLLGCLRGRVAYGVVLGILESDAGQQSQSYAGVALAKIAGRDARGDLLRVMREAEHRRNREGALYGLGGLGDLTVVVPILAAVRDALVGEAAAGSVMARLGLPSGELAAWLRSSDEAQRAVALSAAVFLLSSSTEGRCDLELALVVREALDAGTAKIAPRTIRMLSKRADEFLRGR